MWLPLAGAPSPPELLTVLCLFLILYGKASSKLSNLGHNGCDDCIAAMKTKSDPSGPVPLSQHSLTDSTESFLMPLAPPDPRWWYLLLQLRSLGSSWRSEAAGRKDEIHVSQSPKLAIASEFAGRSLDSASYWSGFSSPTTPDLPLCSPLLGDTVLGMLMYRLLGNISVKEKLSYLGCLHPCMTWLLNCFFSCTTLLLPGSSNRSLLPMLQLAVPNRLHVCDVLFSLWKGGLQTVCQDVTLPIPSEKHWTLYVCLVASDPDPSYSS